MSIQHAILGFLCWKPATGYDLKKLFQESSILYWSGNNNQIYRALDQLHEASLVTQTVEQKEHYPERKVYTITDAGKQKLKSWILTEPEAPQLRNSFMVQLAWADCLQPDELDNLLTKYEAELNELVDALESEVTEHLISPQRTPREAFIWQKLVENRRNFLNHEVDWVQDFRQELEAFETFAPAIA